MKTKTTALLLAGASLSFGLVVSLDLTDLTGKMGADSLSVTDQAAGGDGLTASQQSEPIAAGSADDTAVQTGTNKSGSSQKSKAQQEQGRILAAILPAGEQKEAFAGFLKDISAKFAERGGINWRSIEFQRSKSIGRYGILPVRVSLEISNVNFVQFMHILKKSGSLDERDFFQGEPIRLLAIKQIDIKLPDPAAQADGRSMVELPFRVDIDLFVFYRHENKLAEIDSKFIRALVEARTDFLRAMLDFNVLCLRALDLSAEENFEQQMLTFERFFGRETFQGGVVSVEGLLKDEAGDARGKIQRMRDEFVADDRFFEVTYTVTDAEAGSKTGFRIGGRYRGGD